MLHYAHPCHLISYDMRISAYYIGRANGNLRDLFTVSMVTNWHPLVRSVFIRTTTFWVAWQNCAWKHSKNSIEQQCKREIFVIFYARSFTFYLSLNGLCKAHFSRLQFLLLVKWVVSVKNCKCMFNISCFCDASINTTIFIIICIMFYSV